MWGCDAEHANVSLNIVPGMMKARKLPPVNIGKFPTNGDLRTYTHAADRRMSIPIYIHNAENNDIPLNR